MIHITIRANIWNNKEKIFQMFTFFSFDNSFLFRVADIVVLHQKKGSTATWGVLSSALEAGP